FEDDIRTYPVVYYVTGFSGNESEVLRYMERMPHPELMGDAIVVGLDATNYWGHSVFADSAVTGPWGAALVEELISELEAEFRGAQDAEHRYVTGISSGGWGSLWLQIEYPEVFAGVWSHVPDPVDFNAFQTVDIYADGANIYDYADGSPRPLGRRGEEVMLWARDFIERERVLGPGGQIGSFEAVFSPALEDGTPTLLFDRDTGLIDPRVAEAWKAYDIRRKLEREWDDKQDSLSGKLRVYGGEMDNFYLGEAVDMLAEAMEAMGADEEIVVIEGLPHTFHWEGDADMWRTMAERWESAGK
ncbi:MAG: alpha/beta hydrolase, partial [Planctomycetota bacterium]